MKNKWKVIKIEKLGKIVGGGTPSSNVKEYWNGSVPWITPSDLSSYKKMYIKNGERNITELGYKSSSAKMLPKGTVLLSSRAPIGYVVIADNELCTNQGFKSIVCNETVVNNVFLYYSLKMYKNYLESFASGATFPELSAGRLKKIEIPVPDIKVQNNITAILDKYDKLIENNNRRIEILEEIAQEIYKEWFVRMRFPQNEKVKNEKGKPLGWSYLELKSFGRIVTGKTPSTSVSSNFGGSIPFVKTPDMHGNMFLLNTDETLSEFGANSQKGCWIPENSICVNCIGAKSGSVSITVEKSQTNQQINSIILKDLYNLEFLYFACKELKTTIELFGSTGSTMTNLSKGKFEKLKVLYPDRETILNFHSLVKPMFSEIKALGRANNNLTNVRDLLLPRLMSGKLSVE